MNDDIIEEMEDEERKHPLARCEECPWREESSYAGASGPADAALIVIGEAPGAVETRTGIPFTGPSGQLLDRVLSHHGIDRSTIRFTNVAACHPPYRPGSGSVIPPKEVVAACAPRLASEVAGREVIVLLGNTAKEAILETKEGITSVRSGPPKEMVKYPGVKIIPTIHPAACLRQSDAFPSLVKDIGKIKNHYVKFEPPVFKVFDDPSDAVKVLRELRSKYDTFTLDIETGVDKDVDFTHPSELLCIGIGYAPGKAIVIGEQALLSPRVREECRRIFGSSKLICHNGKYDIQVLVRMGYLDDPYCLWFDTMLASYVCDERPGFHGLKFILADEFGWPSYDDEIHKFTGTGANTLSYAVVPRPILYQYNAYDAAGTFLLYNHFVAKLEKTGLRHVHDRLVRYSHELIYVELEGVAFDLEYNQYLYDHFEDMLQPAEARMRELTGRGTFNPRSHVQVKEVLHDWGVRVPDTAKDTIQTVADRIDSKTELGEFLDLLLQHKLDQKSYSTYVKGHRKRVQKDGRIYSTFLLHGSVTGRTASRNPNLQNVTRGPVLRKQYRPSEGNVFVQCDYGQIEGRVMAVEAREDYLLSIFRDSDRDLFDELGTPLYGSLEAARRKEARVRTKAYFYGMGYGREAYSIAQEYKLPVKQVERDMARFFGNMPNLVKWREEIMQAAKSSALETHFGRRRRFWLVTKENAKDVEKEGLAFKPQSTANDINLSALCEIRKLGLHVRIPVHDSIMVECPEKDKIEVAHTMCEVMERTAYEEYSDIVPFPVDYEFGLNWGELSKD